MTNRAHLHPSQIDASTVCKMRDRDVRSALHAQLLEEHADELDSTRFVGELSLCGEFASMSLSSTPRCQGSN